MEIERSGKKAFVEQQKLQVNQEKKKIDDDKDKKPVQGVGNPEAFNNARMRALDAINESEDENPKTEVSQALKDVKSEFKGLFTSIFGGDKSEVKKVMVNDSEKSKPDRKVEAPVENSVKKNSGAEMFVKATKSPGEQVDSQDDLRTRQQIPIMNVLANMAQNNINEPKNIV